MLGDQDELDRLAMKLQARAGEVRDHAATMMNRALDIHWTSTAAKNYRYTVAQDRIRLHHCADDLESAAAKLRAHAQTVRERIAEIRRIQEAVTNFFRDAVSSLPGAVVDAAESLGGAVIDTFGDIVHGRPPWHDWPFTPDNLPAPDSVEWLKAGDFFRKQGVL